MPSSWSARASPGCCSVGAVTRLTEELSLPVDSPPSNRLKDMNPQRKAQLPAPSPQRPPGALPWMSERSRSGGAALCPSSIVDCRSPLPRPLPSVARTTRPTGVPVSEGAAVSPWEAGGHTAHLSPCNAPPWASAATCNAGIARGRRLESASGKLGRVALPGTAPGTSREQVGSGAAGTRPGVGMWVSGCSSARCVPALGLSLDLQNAYRSWQLLCPRPRSPPHLSEVSRAHWGSSQ